MMSYSDMRLILTALEQGQPVEWRKCNGFCYSEWDDVNPSETSFDLRNIEYRIKPVELRPHWPAVVISCGPDGATRYSISALLFAKPEDLIGKEGALRLATEYPPVMLT